MLLATSRLVILAKPMPTPTPTWRRAAVAHADGSLRRGAIGLGVYVERPVESRVSVRIARPSLADSNYAEMLAILLAVQVSPTSRLVVRTDSLNSLRMLAAAAREERIHAKFQGVACDVLQYIHDRRREPTLLAKVKGHSGDRGNCIADALARRASAG
jgi:ribonuclease HI